MKKYMSVKEMGDLLGIKKTDRYWLLKKGYFKVVTIGGKIHTAEKLQENGGGDHETD